MVLTRTETLATQVITLPVIHTVGLKGNRTEYGNRNEWSPMFSLNYTSDKLTPRDLRMKVTGMHTLVIIIIIIIIIIVIIIIIIIIIIEKLGS